MAEITNGLTNIGLDYTEVGALTRILTEVNQDDYPELFELFEALDILPHDMR